MNQRPVVLFAASYMALVFLLYFLTGLTGLNGNTIIITNMLSYLLIVDPYLFVFIARCSFSSTCSFMSLSRFDHTSSDTLISLSATIVFWGFVGFVAAIAVMFGFRPGKYALLALIVLLSVAAFSNIAVVALFFVSNDYGLGVLRDNAIMNAPPSIVWVASYWFAYQKMYVGIDKSRA